jgi:predicted  nucleic acid-binding Zn-ribbon protein
MKKTSLVVGLLATLLLFSACLDSEKKSFFSDIERMNKKLDSLESAYNELPNDSFKIIKKSAAALEKDVKTYFFEDTIDHEFARKMNKLRGIRKGSDDISMRRAFLDTVFTFQRAQLKTLKTDIDNGAGNRNDYKKFIESESENITTISMSFKDYKLRFDAARFDFYDIAEDIKNRILPLKEKALQK